MKTLFIVCLLSLPLMACNSNDTKEDLTEAVACGTTCALMAEALDFVADPEFGDGDANDAKRRWLKSCALQCALDTLAEE